MPLRDLRRRRRPHAASADAGAVQSAPGESARRCFRDHRCRCARHGRRDVPRPSRRRDDAFRHRAARRAHGEARRDRVGLDAHQAQLPVRRFRQRRDVRDAEIQARRERQRGVLLRHGSTVLRRGGAATQQGRLAARTGRLLPPHRGGEAVWARPCQRPGAERLASLGHGRKPDLPDRSLFGQRNRTEHHGTTFFQRHLRADLETRQHRPRADHRGRDGGRGTTRQVLRGHRRDARHGAQPHLPASLDGGDGSAHFVRRGCGAHGKSQGDTGDPPACRPQRGARRGARPVSRRQLRVRPGAGLPAGAGRGRQLEHRDVHRHEARHRQLAMGRRAVLHPHRQAPGTPSHRNFHPLQTGAVRAVSRHAGREAHAQHHVHAHPADGRPDAAVQRESARPARETRRRQHELQLRRLLSTKAPAPATRPCCTIAW